MFIFLLAHIFHVVPRRSVPYFEATDARLLGNECATHHLHLSPQGAVSYKR